MHHFLSKVFFRQNGDDVLTLFKWFIFKFDTAAQINQIQRRVSKWLGHSPIWKMHVIVYTLLFGIFQANKFWCVTRYNFGTTHLCALPIGLELLKKMTLQASFSRKWFFCEAMLWQHYIPQCCKPMPSLPQLILFKNIM